MDKLFDLMVMAAKYCLLCSTQLEDMVQVRGAAHMHNMHELTTGLVVWHSGNSKQAACACPAQVTLRHLQTVDGIIKAAAAACSPSCTVDAAATHQLLSNAQAATSKFYGGLCTGELLLLRSTLARYFQDKRVRCGMHQSAHSLINLSHQQQCGAQACQGHAGQHTLDRVVLAAAVMHERSLPAPYMTLLPAG
jgi:hypothetical protein